MEFCFDKIPRDGKPVPYDGVPKPLDKRNLSKSLHRTKAFPCVKGGGTAKP